MGCGPLGLPLPSIGTVVLPGLAGGAPGILHVSPPPPARSPLCGALYTFMPLCARSALPAPAGRGGAEAPCGGGASGVNCIGAIGCIGCGVGCDTGCNGDDWGAGADAARTRSSDPNDTPVIVYPLCASRGSTYPCCDGPGDASIVS